MKGDKNMEEIKDTRTLDEILISISRNLDKLTAAQAESNAAYEKRQAEYEEQRKIDKAAAEEQRKIDKAEWKERQAAAEKSMEELKDAVKKLCKENGSFKNNIGAIAEELFYNSIKKGQTNFFGEKYDAIWRNLKSKKDNAEDEYDIVLENCSSVALIEVKYKAHENDIPSILRKAQTIRINYPEYKDHVIYLGLATLHFYKDLETECKKNGIAMIKQVGDTLVIIDGELKPH